MRPRLARRDACRCRLERPRSASAEYYWKTYDDQMLGRHACSRSRSQGDHPRLDRRPADGSGRDKADKARPPIGPSVSAAKTVAIGGRSTTRKTSARETRCPLNVDTRHRPERRRCQRIELTRAAAGSRDCVNSGRSSRPGEKSSRPNALFAPAAWTACFGRTRTGCFGVIDGHMPGHSPRAARRRWGLLPTIVTDFRGRRASDRCDHHGGAEVMFLPTVRGRLGESAPARRFGFHPTNPRKGAKVQHHSDPTLPVQQPADRKSRHAVSARCERRTGCPGSARSRFSVIPHASLGR